MKILLIAAVLGCALISSATGNAVAGADKSSLQLKEAPQNVTIQPNPIPAEPLNEATSPQVQKILSTLPELIHQAAESQLKSTDVVSSENTSAEIVVPTPNAAVHSSREARQLIGYIPAYMLRQAIRFGGDDDDFYNEDDDDIAEERAIRRRKRIRRRNFRGQLNKQRRNKNSNKRNQMKRRKAYMKRKPQKHGNSLQKKKMQRKRNKGMKNKRMKNNNKPNRFY